MAKKNTGTMRVDPKFECFVKNILNKKPRKIKMPRLTLAMYRQYNKYPQLVKELLEADLE